MLSACQPATRLPARSHAKTWLVSTVGRGPYGSRVPGLRSGNGYEEFIASVRADNSGKLFERGCKWMLEYVEPYASQLHDVWLWEEWPHNWGVDHGIDLVAESRSGELWAIQAKAYGPRTRITKKDIDSFVAESSGTGPFDQPIFGQRLLVASTDLLAAAADRLLQRLRIPTVMARDLARLPATWPTDELLAPPQRPRARPRSHQMAAIRDVSRVLKSKEHTRALAVMACGTGKTLVALRVAEILQSQRTAVVVPSLGLLAQTLRYWTANRRPGHEFDALAVCADHTTGLVDDMPIEYVNVVGYPTTTDPSAIAEAMLRDRPLVIFATYRSLRSLSKACRQSGTELDLLIADEAHRCAGSEQGMYGMVLDNQELPSKRRLFMTATPRHYGAVARRRAADNGSVVFSMDDEQHFGPVAHRFGFRRAIESGVICDYRMIIIECRRDVLRHVTERRLMARRGAATTDAEALATQIVTLKAMRDFGLERVLTFHQTIAAAERFSEDLQDVAGWLPDDERLQDEVLADFVTGEMNAAERDRRIRQFATADMRTRRVLSSARCLCEGVDVPAADTVVFAEPGRSNADMVQAVGRALRRAPGKSLGTIVVPLVVPEGAPDKAAVEPAAFRVVMDVVAALRHHDDRVEKVTELRFAKGPRVAASSNTRAMQTILVDAPMLVEPEYARRFNARLSRAVDDANRTAGNPLTFDPSTSKVTRAQQSKPGEDGAAGPDWSSPSTLREGLDALRAFSRGATVGRIDRYSRPYGFPLATWWAGTLHVWENGQLDDAHAERQEIADLVSWLAVDADGHPVVRSEMAKLTSLSVPQAVQAWFDDLSVSYNDVLGAYRRASDAHGALSIADIHRTLTRREDTSEQQVAIIMEVVERIGPVMPSGRPAAGNFREGFVDGASGKPVTRYETASPYEEGLRVGAEFADLGNRP